MVCSLAAEALPDAVLIIKMCTLTGLQCTLHGLVHWFVGDAGAALMVTTIQARPEIWSLCVTRYISRPIMTHLIEQLAANSKLHKVKGSASKHSKKKSMK